VACRKLSAHSGVHHAPNTPDQDGIIERSFRNLKEKRVSRHSFASFAHAKRKLSVGAHGYNDRRRHQAWDFRSPREFSPDEITRLAKPEM